MTLKDFLSKIEVEGMTKKQTEEIVRRVFDTIKSEVANGETVQIPLFGKFASRITSERKGVNPQTGKKIIIPSKRKVQFKASSKWLDNLN